MTGEERRAEAFRVAQMERYRGRLEFARALRGDPVRARAVRDAWAPLLPDPVDGWDVPCEPEPARPAWVARVPGDVELPEYLKREPR